MTRRGLLVVGDVVTDIVARQEGPLRRATDTAARIGVRPGGSGANTAAWAARQGADVRLLARVGAEHGPWHRRQLERRGVRAELRTDDVRPTAQVIVLVDPDGERTMVTDRGAGGRIGPADWDDALLDGVGLLHLSGYVLFTAAGRALAAVARAAAERAGVEVSVDPASVGFLDELGADAFLELTRDCALVLPNADEAALLTAGDGPRPGPEEAAVRLSRRHGLAVVKRGAAGAVAARDGRLVADVPAVPARVRDLTGAGDAFAGGLLAARLRGADLTEALHAACRTGAEAVTLLGGRPPAGGDRDGDAPAPPS